MKKNAIVLLMLSVTLSAQKQNILKSQNIAEIEQFLKTSHPEDPRRIVLKPKLAALKNSQWTQGAKNAKPMAARPVVTDIPNAVIRRPNSAEAEEFKALMTETSDAHKAKTVKLLNTLFDQDINKKEAIVLIQNNSNCNLILRFKGEKDFYNLAVPSKGENTLVLNKGIYEVSSNVCDVQYASTKNISKSQMITLNQPVYRDLKGSASNNSSLKSNR